MKNSALLIFAAVASLGLTACNDEETVTNDFVVTLSGSSEVPPVETTARGTATIDIDEASNTVVINVRTSGISPNPTAAHLHTNFAGANGPVLFPLTQQPNLNNFSGTTTLTSEQITTLNNGGMYINVHSAAVPSGELRGQVLGADVSLISFPLEGSQENPPVSTASTGNATITLIGDEGLEVRATHDIDNSTAAHIHNGIVGVNGPVLVALTQVPASSNGAGTITGSISGDDFTDELRNGIRDGNLYVNLHSTTNPSGELRGQIVDGGVPESSTGSDMMESGLVLTSGSDEAAAP